MIRNKIAAFLISFLVAKTDCLYQGKKFLQNNIINILYAVVFKEKRLRTEELIMLYDLLRNIWKAMFSNKV